MPRNDPDRAKERAYMKRYRAMHRTKLLQYGREWYQKHRACIRAADKAWRRANPERARLYEYRSRLKVEYGLTLKDLEAIKRKQRGRCAICRRKPKRLVVDHCHVKDRVRGLLCDNCNFILGHAKDNSVVLEAAARYLKLRTMEKLQGAEANRS